MAAVTGLNWPRISKWCVLGSIVMVGWLLVPTVRCSWAAFRATPLDEEKPTTVEPGQTDQTRVQEERGFVDTVTSAAKVCYARTPLLGQEEWKNDVLYALLAVGAVSYALGKWEQSRKKTYGS